MMRGQLRMLRGSDAPASRTVDHPDDAIVLIGECAAQNEWLRRVLGTRPWPIRSAGAISGARRLLEEHPRSVGLFQAARSSSARPNAVLEELGAEVLARTIVLAKRTSFDEARAFVEAGAADFQVLPALRAELVLRIERRLADVKQAPAERAANLRDETPVLERILGPRAEGGLTDREQSVFGLLAERLGQPVSRDDILARVWEHAPGTRARSNIVDVYVRYLRVKLHRVAPELRIRSVRRVGYLLDLAQ